MLDIEMHLIPLFLLTGVSCFFMGAIFQQDVSIRTLAKLMQLDPYIYQRRHHIFTAFGHFGGKDEEESINGIQLKRKKVTELPVWLRNQLFNIFSFFLCPNYKNTPGFIKPTAQLKDIMKYGFPGLDCIQVYRDFVLSYDRRNRIAHWVCQHLRGSQLIASNTEEHEESALEDNEDADHYTDFIRGPELKYISEEGTHDAEFKGLNSIAWRRLEEYVQEVTDHFGSVYVYTGPLYLPKRLDYQSWAVRYEVVDLNTVAVVPTHFFKVIIIESQCLKGLPYMEGYVIPNTNIDVDVSVRTYLCDIRDIEHFSGLKFYDGLRRTQFYEVIEF